MADEKLPAQISHRLFAINRSEKRINMRDVRNSRGKSKVVRYNKWGYIFLIPFVLVYVAFQLVPLFSTIFNSFFENYRAGLKQIGPNWVGIANYVTIFSDASILKYTANTLIMWVIGFVPQILVSLLLGQWFSDIRLKLKGSRFFKTVIYLPNLIMASAFSMLFFALFSDVGPINAILIKLGIVTADNPVRFFSSVWATRGLVGFMNFLMWFGNTTIILMAGIMGIDPSLFEAAEVDGASSWQRFYRITLPLLKPILIYVIITSMIGGIQMFDVPQILTNGSGAPAESTKTLIMYLNQHLYSRNYGLGGALSVFLFIITAILSLVIYSVMYRKKD